MIQDFHGPAVGTEHVADLCIVGAGPAGLAIAHRFLDSGTDVLVVESGGLDPDAGADELNAGENVGLPLSLREGRTRTYGGTGTLWPGQCIRLDRSDLEARDWVPGSGWPLDRDQLDPYYRRAASWLGIPQDTFDEQAWRRFGLVPPPFSPDYVEHRSSMYSKHPDVGAFYRSDIERSSNVRVLVNASVSHVDTSSPDGVVGDLTIRSLSGRVGRVRARTTVLCGGGIENARLLLLSGYGQRNDTVGRFLQDHPTLWVDLATNRAASLQEFYGWLGRGKVRYVPRMRLAPQVQSEHRVLNAIATLIHDRADTPGLVAAREISSALQERRWPRSLRPADVRDVLRELPRVAIGAFRRFVQGRPSAAPLERTRVQILLEQSPNSESRISLSSERDQLGLQKARVDWRLSDRERRTARVFVEVLDAELRRLGLGHLTGFEWLDGDDWTKGFEDAYHPIGTTRMADDPTAGVVDADCRVHGLNGLYVCGTSVFPTSGYANPTLTIVALALRLADHLETELVRAATWT
ncbi:GMC family oxidoreductase [Pseudonocardia sp. KRD-184]|uniref:GMC family oxidoreductase n=1 Tax=Pseudonocardia oceani TaxID=2792013 RepID=A0ABS6U5D8_9PSEU|nr:GMC family oxidoreductase [Pseudonocardia oceani]MBW0092490.1 GMC family oxidoreductase [Pseudonocardia oceani]MBW0099415.1 GMC family oxidoreductase [Pseudonocardia oceani]MBW0125284.1 GMC family oxidoreductase [Pseudonocardia oceani]MBW0127452.1 GMC family oxidoreductase [Pseudonocardia oceani]